MNVRSPSASTRATSKPVSTSGAGSRLADPRDVLRGQGPPPLLAPRAGAVTTAIEDGQALPDGGGHDVEPAADFDGGGLREHVSAALGQCRDPHQQVDNRLACEQKPR